MASCQSCYPIGNINLTRSYDRAKREVTFYRNNVMNANGYTLTLYKDGSVYGTYQMTGTSQYISNLASGTYTADLTAQNTNTGQRKSTSCQSFTIVDTYDVVYDANGGTNAPSTQHKIKDFDLTITSSVPSKTGHIFKGWASSKTATEAQYQPGDSYTKNTKITLYAVWEPEIYTINFDVNGGKGEVESTTIAYGNSMKMPNSVIREGYYLKGWAHEKGATIPDYKLGLDYQMTANTTLYAVWDNSTWSGAVSAEFAGGDGSEDNPYQISNAAELAHLADIVNNQHSEPEYKYYILTDNISLGYEEWLPIGLYGNEYQYFYGSFDGNGYTISDLSITDVNEGYVGLFGYAKGGEIKRLNVCGDITGITGTEDNNYIGAVIAYADNTDINNCNISYVNISDITKNTGAGISPRLEIGGICGFSDGSISNCRADECYIGVREGISVNIGIIVAHGNAISNCAVKSSEELFGFIGEGWHVNIGGICGVGHNIHNCEVTAGSLINNVTILDGLATSGIGGIVGTMPLNLTGFEPQESYIDNCSVKFTNGKEININGKTYKVSINVSSNSSSGCVGGIVGHGGEIIKNCKYDGESIAADVTRAWHTQIQVGGIGGNGRNINKCFANVNGSIIGNLFSPWDVADNAIAICGIGGYTVSNAVAIADEISAASDTSVNAVRILSSDITLGDEYDNVYSYSGMNVIAKNAENSQNTTTSIIGAKRTLTQIKRASFLNQVFGPAYQSLEYLKENPEAVWVIREGEYPELYFTELRDITLSDVENGTISVDKSQAVDGELVTVTAVPNENYILNKVYINGKEIVGTTFEVDGDSDVYATFAEKTAVYNIAVEADTNASASLVNMDSISLTDISFATDNTSITANDGEEIKVNTVPDSEYTVDAVYVNGEELISDSFIVTDDSKVTLDVTSISTDVKAQTYSATGIGSYYATLRGSVEGESSVKYIRYWAADNPDEIYTTDIEEGGGAYSVKVWNLEPGTEYMYQMTEAGDIKSFITLDTAPDGDYEEDPIEPEVMPFMVSDVNYVGDTISAKTTNQSDVPQSGVVICAAYNETGTLLKVSTYGIENMNSMGFENCTFDAIAEADKYKIFVWNNLKSMKPLAESIEFN